MTSDDTPSPAADPAASESRFPGQRLGMPESGPGAVAGMGRRLLALGIDWALCSVFVYTLLDMSPATAGYVVLLGYAVQAIVLQVLLGSTVGKRIAGIRMGSVGSSAMPWPSAIVVRTLLLCLVVPALINDQDGRGLHDRVAGTVSARF